MRLFEDDDFGQAVSATARDLDLPESFIEKDYYITEALRLLAERYGELVVFKGGTSLSKAWGLIRRLSEDIDLLIVKARFKPPLGAARIAKELVSMRDTVDSHPGLEWRADGSLEFGGSRRDVFSYRPRFDEASLASTVMTEPGVAGGDHPTSEMEIESYVGRFVRSQGDGDLWEDVQPFSVTTLHFRRTFVEKLFVVHALAERLKASGELLGRDARHYYDLHALAGQAEVLEMIESGEYPRIKEDCRKIGLKFFKKKYLEPAELSFAGSDGVFPPGRLHKQIEADYLAQCRLLCFGEYPSFDEVIGRLEALRDRL